MEWINVKERMPIADGNPVLCRIQEPEPFGRMTVIAYPPHGIHGDRWILDMPRRKHDFALELNEVTHWMPLPAPPKDEQR